MLVRKTRNISVNRRSTACKFLKFHFYDQACSETGGASVTAIKIRKKLDVQKESCKTIVRWGGWVNHRTKLHKNTEGEGRKVSYKHELTSKFLIYCNSLYYHRQPHLINPIIKQSSFNYKVVWLLAPIRPTEKLLQTHTPVSWKQSPNFQLLLWFISTWFLNLKNSFPILLFNPNTFIESSHMAPLPFGYAKVMLT